MPWNAITSAVNHAMNYPVQVGFGITQLIQARKQRESQNYYNAENLALAKEAFAAQQNQQALENEWYPHEQRFAAAMSADNLSR